MYGKHHDTTYSGSMFGAGLAVFAVWGYVIANTRADHRVELNARVLAACLGGPVDEIRAAIEILCGPDPESRSKEHGGRRLVREGEYLYFVVNHNAYRDMRSNEDRREYFKLAKREQRARRVQSSPIVMSTVSTHTDTEADTETEQRQRTSRDKRVRHPRTGVSSEDRKALDDAAAPLLAIATMPSDADHAALRKNILAIATVPKPVVKPPSWTSEACDDFIAAYGGTAPGGVIGKALKPLVAKHEWPAVRDAWVRYLSETSAEYVSAPRFAATYGHWSGTARNGMAIAGGARPSEKARARSESFVAGLKGGLRDE